jgi:hypothetical protein
MTNPAILLLSSNSISFSFEITDPSFLPQRNHYQF